MSNVIFKYVLTDGSRIQLPYKWEPIRVGRIPGDENLYMWALHPHSDDLENCTLDVCLHVRCVEIGVVEKQKLELRIDATILHVEDIDGRFYLWYAYDATTIGMQTRKIEMYKTGMPIDSDADLRYIGFCRLFIMQELGLYVFERF